MVIWVYNPFAKYNEMRRTFQLNFLLVKKTAWWTKVK